MILFLYSVEPVDVLGLIKVQGLFESRQIEVSDEFGGFMERRVLNSSALLTDLSDGEEDGDLYKFLRKHLPYPIPSHILIAAVHGVRKVAENPRDYPEVHGKSTFMVWL